MKIRLINTITLIDILFPNVGLAYINGYLKNQGADSEIFDLDIVVKDLNSKKNGGFVDLNYMRNKIWNIPKFLNNELVDEYFDEQITKVISLFSFNDNDILCFSTHQREFFLPVYIAKKIREKVKCPIFIGGLEVNKIKEAQLYEMIKFFQMDYVDYFVRAGTYKFFEKVINNDLPLKNNLARVITYKDDNTAESPIVSRKGIPFYNKNHLNLYRIHPKKLEYFFPNLNVKIIDRFKELSGTKRPLVMPHLFQEGCSNNCAYCGFPKSFGRINLEKINSEISYLKKTYKTNNFFFLNSNIAFNSKYTYKIVKNFKEEHDIMWSDTANVSMVNPEMIKKFSESGCIELFMGISTASKRLQDYVFGKVGYNRNQHISKCFKAADKNGIWVVTDVICGLPYEGKSDILKTKNFLMDNREYINGIMANRFRMMQNSPFAKNPSRYGLDVYRNDNYRLTNVSNKSKLDILRYGLLEFNEVYGLKWSRKVKNIDASHNYFLSLLENKFPKQISLWYPLYLLYNNFDSKKDILKFLGER
ncbi:MAG: B12-binding domain-containing radical SAM protein [Nanobdellota archaeon]